MKPFEFHQDDIISPEFISGEAKTLQKAVKNPDLAAYQLPNSRGTIAFSQKDGKIINESELSNQFIVFQLSNKEEGAPVFESSEVTPLIDGSKEEPDILMSMEMQSFHIGKDVEVDKKTRATMRINIGKDENSSDKYFDAAFWSIAAGLDLYNQIKKKPVEPRDLKTDFKQAFGNRPIEIPGGLAKMTFEVVKHLEPRWWQRIFKFLKSDTGTAFTSAIGFPAITNTAINLIDELLNKLNRSKPEVLFKSRPLRLALSKKAKDEYTGGSERVRIGSLSPGFCVLARGRDFKTLINANAYYYPTYGKLVPAHVSNTDLLSGNYHDPFKNVTYAIFRIGMKAHKLDPNFNYGQSVQ
ncbi:hypothetical protein OOZ15_05810 [Galbibacter sp. EGI 63066]|uniref:hypothetical protein n=1 Tax=Galbibacter sp. EGI 63066 TaxID=2993559 RepID=UPI002248B0F8|nr:hypothetical protein [Galbibacter sp. EGI 63066]MCX2679453.1 hypothetical protein [Galbibacter sp. EGI 63066]